MAISEVRAEVLSNKAIIPSVMKMVLRAPEIASQSRPGQFVNVRCGETFDPLLRRPISVYGVGPGDKEPTTIELVYKIVGRGTERLARTPAGSFIEVLGPLGRGFEIRQADEQILIAGGIGVASLMYLATEIVREVRLKRLNSRILALIGGHTAEELVCVEEIGGLGPEVNLRTWITRVGLRKCLDEVVGETGASRAIYACGPNSMLKSVAGLALEKGIPCQVSLEAHMACGVGACQSCICHMVKGEGHTYGLVCRDGPVFDAGEVAWNEYD